jgi:hypothetical protein
MNLELALALIVAITGSFGLFRLMEVKIKNIFSRPTNGIQATAYAYDLCCFLAYGLIFFACSLSLLAGSYNPFIYYRF